MRPPALGMKPLALACWFLAQRKSCGIEWLVVPDPDIKSKQDSISCTPSTPYICQEVIFFFREEAFPQSRTLRIWNLDLLTRPTHTISCHNHLFPLPLQSILILQRHFPGKALFICLKDLKFKPLSSLGLHTVIHFTKWNFFFSSLPCQRNSLWSPSTHLSTPTENLKTEKKLIRKLDKAELIRITIP